MNNQKYLTLGGRVVQANVTPRAIRVVVEIEDQTPLFLKQVVVFGPLNEITTKIKPGNVVLVCDAIATTLSPDGLVESVESPDVTRIDPKWWEQQTKAHLAAKESWRGFLEDPFF